MTVLLFLSGCLLSQKGSIAAEIRKNYMAFLAAITDYTFSILSAFCLFLYQVFFSTHSRRNPVYI